MSSADQELADLLKPAAAKTVPESTGFYNFLKDDPDSTGPAQDLMLSKPLTLVYERLWRPALGRVAKGLLGPSMEDEMQIARLLLALKPGHRVLDIACGTGGFTRNFAEIVGSEGLAIGADVSRPMLERAAAETASKHFDNVAYVRASATELPFKRESFDAVCCFAALHLFPDPPAALGQMRNVLATSGRIAIFTSVTSRTRSLHALETQIGKASGMRMFGQEELRDELTKRGFTDIRQKFSGMTQFIGGRLEKAN